MSYRSFLVPCQMGVTEIRYSCTWLSSVEGGSFCWSFTFFSSGFTHQPSGCHILEHTRNVKTNRLLHSLEGLEHGKIS